jgi:hypothetical protein
MMSRILAVVIVVCLVQLFAFLLMVAGMGNMVAEAIKKIDRSDERPTPTQIGRHVVVRTSPEEIILMDSVTGELYRALNSDIKTYIEIFPSNDDESQMSEDDSD